MIKTFEVSSYITQLRPPKCLHLYNMIKTSQVSTRIWLWPFNSITKTQENWQSFPESEFSKCKLHLLLLSLVCIDRLPVILSPFPALFPLFLFDVLVFFLLFLVIHHQLALVLIQAINFWHKMEYQKSIFQEMKQEIGNL